MGEKLKDIFEYSKITITVLLFIINFGAVIFSAGKLTQSINQNTLAIQQNTSMIQKNSADIVGLKEYKAGTEAEIKNLSEKVNEISIDVKELLKK